MHLTKDELQILLIELMQKMKSVESERTDNECSLYVYLGKLRSGKTLWRMNFQKIYQTMEDTLYAL